MPSAALADGVFDPHDLLWIDGVDDLLTDEPIPLWVFDTLCAAPVVVVRRGSQADGLVPIGIRGSARHQRFAATIDADRPTHRIKPEDLVATGLVPAPERASLPALAAFIRVLAAWKDVGRAWGPTGSVGFELATGRPTVTGTSDLDLIVRAPERFSRFAGWSLLAPLEEVGVQVDIRIETRCGSFALREFCEHGTAGTLIKSRDGIRLATDPWSEDAGDVT